MRCDSHVHVVGPQAKFPQVDQRTFTAAEAPLDQLRKLGAHHSIERFVIVQASFYGADNTVLLEALSKLGRRGAGVATVSSDADIGLVRDLKNRGIRGLRVNAYSPAAINVDGNDDLAGIAKLAAAAGMHVEIIAPLPLLVRDHEKIARFDVPVILDHYGLFGTARPEGAEGQAILRLFEHEHVWMKLSSPYRQIDAPLNTVPDQQWLDAYLDVGVDRCVWGSDWPHPPAHDDHQGPQVVTPFRSISYSELVHKFEAAFSDPDQLDAVMNRNPARFYQFEDE